MAKPPTFEARVSAGQRAAERAGTKFFIYPGAQQRCRCCSGAHNPNGPFIRAWGTWIGIIRHITAGGLGSRTMETYIRDILVNDPAVPFKSQWSVAPNGDIWLIGTGRANHCLNMSQQAYDALVNGTFPLDQFCVNMRGSALVGSAYTDGIEQVAASAPTAVQANATDYLEAELIRPYGWSGTDTAGHGEVASDRGPGDPNEHMGNTRTRIRNIVGGSTPPPTEEDDLMGYTPDDLRKYAREGALDTRIREAGPTPEKEGTGPTMWALATEARDAAKAAERAANNASAAVARIEAALAQRAQ